MEQLNHFTETIVREASYHYAPKWKYADWLTELCDEMEVNKILEYQTCTDRHFDYYLQNIEQLEPKMELHEDAFLKWEALAIYYSKNTELCEIIYKKDKTPEDFNELMQHHHIFMVPFFAQATVETIEFMYNSGDFRRFIRDFIYTIALNEAACVIKKLEEYCEEFSYEHMAFIMALTANPSPYAETVLEDFLENYEDDFDTLPFGFWCNLSRNRGAKNLKCKYGQFAEMFSLDAKDIKKQKKYTGIISEEQVDKLKIEILHDPEKIDLIRDNRDKFSKYQLAQVYANPAALVVDYDFYKQRNHKLNQEFKLYMLKYAITKKGIIQINCNNAIRNIHMFM